MKDTNENIEKAQSSLGVTNEEVEEAVKIYANSAATKASYGLPSITVKGENILDYKKHSFVIDICKQPYDWRETARLIEHIFLDWYAIVNSTHFINHGNEETVRVFKSTLKKKRAHMKSCITMLSKQIPGAASLDVDYLEQLARQKADKLYKEYEQNQKQEQ